MQKDIHEFRSVGLILAFIGGAVDLYTYMHYDSFASAQTGNLILAIMQTIDGQWGSVWKKFLSTLFFFLGIFFGKALMHYFRKRNWPFWRLIILYAETLLFFLFSLSFIHEHTTLVTIAISFITAAQWISFDKINGRVYTSLFTTGNLKGMAAGLYDYLLTRDKKALGTFIHFTLVVVAFLIGAVVLGISYRVFAEKSILIISALFLYLSISQTILVLRYYRSDYSA